MVVTLVLYLVAVGITVPAIRLYERARYLDHHVALLRRLKIGVRVLPFWWWGVPKIRVTFSDLTSYDLDAKPNQNQTPKRYTPTNAHRSPTIPNLPQRRPRSQGRARPSTIGRRRSDGPRSGPA